MHNGVLAVTGMRTSIVGALRTILPEGERIEALGELTAPTPERVLIADGLIYSKPLLKQTEAEIRESLWCNLVSTVRICNLLLERNPEVRIVVMGSESGINGSYDETYALAKAGLHAYVKWHRTKMNQQLVCVCPPLIADSWWVSQRGDYPEVLERRPHCKAIDVARIIKGTLYAKGPEFTNCIVRVRPSGGPGAGDGGPPLSSGGHRVS